MSQPTAEQRQLIESWAAEGANLNQIQDRLRTECGVSLTYMEARLLILEIGVKIQEKPRPAPPPEEKAPAPVAGAEGVADGVLASGAPAGTLTVTADQIPLSGAVISGKATFSDGQTVVWFMDEMGRFGMNGAAPGYQPPPADVPAFQAELDRILSARGF